MIGINLGSLNTSISVGTPSQASGRLHCELLISDTSGRSCPSIISFTNTHRLIGDQAILIMKKNCKSTFNHLIRLIGFRGNSEFDRRELSYITVGGDFNYQTSQFKLDIQGSTEQRSITPESIVIGYLNKIKQSYLTQKNIFIDNITFATPDYFTCFHKERFIEILRSCGFSGNNVHIVNESTAITLYFGYKRYSEYFISQNVLGNNKASVDPTIEKYVIFIDAGHSKTTFIFSKLVHNLFTVLSSMTIPFLGGRDFDNEIFKYCANVFLKQSGIDINKNIKIKLRMMERIAKWRKALTVNTDVQFSFESLADDQDLNFLMTRTQFESIIRNKTQEFKSYFSDFYKHITKQFPNAVIKNIEMAGELLRTPVLQDIIKEVSGISVSKTILTDECIAIGCSLYSSIMKGTFPLQNFMGIYHLNNYSIVYSIENINNKQQHKQNNQLYEFIRANTQIPYDAPLMFPINQFGEVGKIKITFYHQPSELDYYLHSNTYELISYIFDLNIIYKQQKGKSQGMQAHFKVDNNGFIHLQGIELVYGEHKTEQLHFSQGMVEAKRNGIYYDKDKKQKVEQYLYNEENNYMKRDKEFDDYYIRKNNIEGKCYSLRDAIYNSRKERMLYKNTNRTLIDVITTIEETLRDAGDNIINLDPIYQQLLDIASMVGYVFKK